MGDMPLVNKLAQELEVYLCGATVPGWVYFISGKGLVKIGYSWMPDRRLKDLQRGSAVPLKLEAKAEGTMQHEFLFHAAFARSHHHAEWFRRTPSLTAVITRIQGGEALEDVLQSEVAKRRKGPRIRVLKGPAAGARYRTAEDADRAILV